MKPSVCPPPRRFALFPAACLGLLLAASGCGRATLRPASSVSPADQTTLAQYEQIRAALANDDVRTAKAAAAGMVTLLKAADAKAPGAAALAPAETLAAALALDRARQTFKQLSAKVIPLAQGVEGYYVMTCPLPSAGDWVQRTPDVDNPYLGKAMHEYGELKK